MQTNLADFIKGTPEGREADAILRTCVHCGFCTATCPTYQLLGDELDGPRGRIYLIKQMLEGKEVTEKTQTHLDRCLTCRSCETTCPSGVKYSHLLDVGRAVVEQKLPRRLGDLLTRTLLKTVLPNPALFAPAVKLGRAMKPLLPSSLADKLPPVPSAAKPWPASSGHRRRMLALAGCVQPALAPNINAATARVLDRLGIALVEESKAGCCGAVRFHLNDQAAGKADMRRNIDAWWPQVEAGLEAIVVTASGCGVQVRDYGHLLADDPAYAAKAVRISELCRDPADILAAEKVADLVAAKVRAYLDSPAAVGEHLADQLALPMALAGGGSFTTCQPSSHLTTNLAVIEHFLPLRSQIEYAEGRWLVGIG